MRNENIEGESVDQKDALKEEKLGIKDNKKALKYFLLIFSILVICGATVGIIIYRYNSLKIESGGNIISTTPSEVKGKEYIADLDYKYYTNPISINEKEYKQGKVKVDGKNEDKINVGYIQISGLKDKSIENKINKEIKDEALKIPELKSNQQYRAAVSIFGNFNNILSVIIYKDISNTKTYEMEKSTEIYLTYNLCTGEKLNYDDVLTSDMPINHVIYESLYKQLAWDTEYSLDWDEEKIDKATNMDRRDTSEYEDIILKSIRAFKDLDKSETQFAISPSMMVFGNVSNEKFTKYSFYLYKYKDYVTVYKKFLKNENIFEKSYTASNHAYRRDSSDTISRLIDEKYSDNAYIDMFEYKFDEEEETKIKNMSIYSKILNYKKEGMADVYSKLKKIADSNKDKGFIFRGRAQVVLYEESSDYGNEKFIHISVVMEASVMSKDYFKNNLYSIYAAHAVKSRADVSDEFEGEFLDSNIKTDEKYNVTFEVYIDKTGKVVANSADELENYLKKKYKKTNVSIYSE